MSPSPKSPGTDNDGEGRSNGLPGGHENSSDEDNQGSEAATPATNHSGKRTAGKARLDGGGHAAGTSVAVPPLLKDCLDVDGNQTLGAPPPQPRQVRKAKRPPQQSTKEKAEREEREKRAKESSRLAQEKQQELLNGLNANSNLGLTPPPMVGPDGQLLPGGSVGPYPPGAMGGAPTEAEVARMHSEWMDLSNLDLNAQTAGLALEDVKRIQDLLGPTGQNALQNALQHCSHADMFRIMKFGLDGLGKGPAASAGKPGTRPKGKKKASHRVFSPLGSTSSPSPNPSSLRLSLSLFEGEPAGL